MAYREVEPVERDPTDALVLRVRLLTDARKSSAGEVARMLLMAPAGRWWLPLLDRNPTDALVPRVRLLTDARKSNEV